MQMHKPQSCYLNTASVRWYDQRLRCGYAELNGESLHIGHRVVDWRGPELRPVYVLTARIAVWYNPTHCITVEARGIKSLLKKLVQYGEEIHPYRR